MKSTLLASIISITSFSGKADKVYICKGAAYAYHKTKNCRYLSQCTHTIVELTLAAAKAENRRTPCKPCYR